MHQSLLPQCEDTPYYWSAESRAEVDFLLPLSTENVPVEVKSERRVSGKSLSVYTKKYQPSRRVSFSMNNLQQNDGLLSCPLPLADRSIRLLGILLAPPRQQQVDNEDTLPFRPVAAG